MADGIKVLGICGSHVKDGNTESFLKHALTAAEESGALSEAIFLSNSNLHDCLQCNYCLRKQQEGKFCSQQDQMTEIYPKILAADALIVASPTYFGRLSGLTAIFLDRLRAFIFGNVYGGRLKNKVGGALAVGYRRNAGTETTLLSIDYSFLALEMIVASAHSYGSFYGAGSYSSIEGTGQSVKNDKQIVLRNASGLKSAAAIGIRAVELARIIKTGEGILRETNIKSC